MAVQLRAVSTAAIGATPLAITKPTGTAAGDLMLLAVAATTGAINLPFQTGWILLPSGSINGDDNIAVWVKIAGASEPASYTVEVGATGTTGAAILSLYSDSAAALGISDVAYQSNASSTNRTFPSVEFSAAGYWVGFGHFGAFTSTPPGGWTEHFDTTTSGNRFYGMSRAQGSGTSGTAAATGTAQTSKCVSVAVVETTFAAPGPRHRASGSTTGSAVGSSIAVTAPATIVAGDFLLLQLTATASRTISDPAGWTAITPVTGAGGIYAWYKIANDTDASSTITVSFTGGSTTMSLIVTPFYSPRGWDIELDAVATATQAAATSVTFPTVTASAANATLCLLAGRTHGTGFDPAGDIPLWRLIDSGASARLTLLMELLESAGATGTRTVAWSSGTLAATMISLTLIEVEPVAAILRRIYPSEGYYSVVYADTDLTTYLRVGDLTGDTEPLNTMSLADDHPTTEPGTTTWQISLGGPLTKALDDLLGKDALSPPATMRDLLITIGETGNATTYTWIGTSEVGAFVSNYRVGPNVQFAEVPFRADLGVSGQPTRGTA